MKKQFDVTFIDKHTNRRWTYDNVIAVHFNGDRVMVHCKEKSGDSFNTVEYPDEFTDMLISEVVNDETSED